MSVSRLIVSEAHLISIQNLLLAIQMFLISNPVQQKGEILNLQKLGFFLAMFKCYYTIPKLLVTLQK